MAASKLVEAGAQPSCLLALMKVGGCPLVQELVDWCHLTVKCVGKMSSEVFGSGCDVRISSGWGEQVSGSYEDYLLWGFWLFSSSVPVQVCAYLLTSTLTNLARQTPARKKVLLFLVSTQFLFSSEGIKVVQSVDTYVPACVFSLHSSPLKCLLPCREEGYFRKKKTNQPTTKTLNVIQWNSSHRIGIPIQVRKKNTTPFLNITFHMVNPSESLLWNE